MKTISATFEVVTPMFLGGADQSPDGIRPSSIKGALRFWWRAWAWSGIRANCNDDNAGLQALHREEARLFGLAAQNDSGGQGLFMLHVRDSTRQSLEQPFGTGFDNGILYLLGQGLGEARPLHLGGNKCKGERGAIQAKETFEIRLIFKPRTTPQDQESILTALKLFGLLGALGSRARHGLGSVAIQSLAGQGIDNWKPPATEDEYVAQLSALMPSALAKNAPPLSALSQLTRIDLSSRHADATKLLDTVGKEQQAYRSYGQQDKKSGIHMVNGKPSESNFAKDHDLAMQVTQGNRVDKAPDRIVFGLPHNYFFSSLQKRVISGFSCFL